MLNTPFREALQEIRASLLSLILIMVLLDSVIIFLVFYMLLRLFGLPGALALLPAIFYYFAKALSKLHTNTVAMVESRYKHLNEKLRTARDNMGSTSQMLAQLQEELFTDLKAVELSTFLNQKKVIVRTALLVALCFLLILLPVIHIAALVAPLPAPIAGALNRTLLGMQRGDLPPDQLTGGPGKAGDVPGPTDIYGAASIARVGNDELKISIPPKNYDLNVRSSSDVPQESFSQRGITPEEVYPASSPPDDPNIPLEQQEIVKRYFKALAGG